MFSRIAQSLRIQSRGISVWNKHFDQIFVTYFYGMSQHVRIVCFGIRMRQEQIYDFTSLGGHSATKRCGVARSRV